MESWMRRDAGRIVSLFLLLGLNVLILEKQSDKGGKNRTYIQY